MAIVIILIIAFWYLDLPLALQILMTVFGSLHCIFRIIGLCIKGYKNSPKQERTGNKLVDDALERLHRFK